MEVAQPIKYLSHETEDLGSDPQKPHTKPGTAACAPVLGEGSQKEVDP